MVDSESALKNLEWLLSGWEPESGLQQWSGMSEFVVHKITLDACEYQVGGVQA